ncbi:hypothetical protein D3C71_1731750 [compost metagenome]
MGERCGQQIDMALLQLRNACRHRQLLEHRLDADLLRDCLAQIHVVAHQFAGLGIDEAVGLIRAQHAYHEFALFLDVCQQICLCHACQQYQRRRSGSPYTGLHCIVPCSVPLPSETVS